MFGSGHEFLPALVLRTVAEEGLEGLGTVSEHTTAWACGEHVAGRGCRGGLMRNRRSGDAALPG